MNRWLALALGGLCTVLFLEGVAVGAALGVEIARARTWPAIDADWSEIGEIVLWVALLMSPAVSYLRTRRREVWRVAGALALGVVLVSYARFRIEPSGRVESLAWAAAEGAAFLLGLLFFDLVAGMLERGDRAPSPAAPGLGR